MTGPWLIVKWAGLAVLAASLSLTALALWRFRNKPLRSRVFQWSAILGNFVWIGLPMVFENVTVTRVCFVVGLAIYLGGTMILIRDLGEKDRESLSKADDVGEHFHSLKLS